MTQEYLVWRHHPDGIESIVGPSESVPLSIYEAIVRAKTMSRKHPKHIYLVRVLGTGGSGKQGRAVADYRGGKLVAP